MQEITAVQTIGHRQRLVRISKHCVEIYDRIERLVDGPYLELFSRGSRPGWHQIGDQTGLFDAGPADTRRTPSNMSRQESLF